MYLFLYSHRNGQIRKICAKAIADIAEKIGSSRILSIHKDILAVSAKLATDSQQDSRYHGRRILNLLLDYPDLDKMIIKDLPTASVRAVQEIIENLRQKVPSFFTFLIFFFSYYCSLLLSINNLE